MAPRAKAQKDPVSARPPAPATQVPEAARDERIDLELEGRVADALADAVVAGERATGALRTAAERIVDLRISLDDLDGSGPVYQAARRRVLDAAGLTNPAQAARLERNLRYHVGEVLAARGLRPRSPSRTPGRRAADGPALALKALASIRKLKSTTMGSADVSAVLDVLDELEAACAQVRRALTSPVAA